MNRVSMIIVFILITTVLPLTAVAENRFTVLSYHDIQDEVPNGSEVMAIDTHTLVAHFAWLREHGYRVISLDDIVAANEGRRLLPDKAILLTFDDGYRSVYTRVYPLLKLFNYKAVIGPVGKWMETEDEERVDYGDKKVSRDRFLTWPQVKALVDSGLVEVASHSYDLHQGLIANPQGNDQPAATTKVYDTENGRYETDDQYLQRLRLDLSKSVELIEHHTGKKPRAIIWPYGSYNRQSIDIANALGMTITMGLGDGANDVSDVSALRRILIPHQGTLSDFVWTLRNPGLPRRIRVAHVDLDYLYDEDPERQAHNLGLLLDRIEKLGINTVYLQAFADPDGNGSANALYFPNRHLPMRADLFNRVAWQLQTRAGVRVYAWMPVLAFEFESGHPLEKYYVQTAPSATLPSESEDYRRLSPFHPEGRKIVGEIYEDLAKHADFSGLLFHDDAFLSDFEDASQWARDFYATEWKLPDSIDEIRSSPELLAEWTDHKIRFLIEWTNELENRVRQYRPEIKTARNLYASVALNPDAEQWFSQSLEAFLDRYDYTAVMAMPYLEGAKNADKWLETLVKHVSRVPGGLDKTVFELQSIDWNTHTTIGSESLAHQMKLLIKKGVVNFGYYPDDFIQGYPEISVIKSGISLNTDPYR